MDAVSVDAADFLERTTLRELLNVAPGIIDQARQVAYQLYRAGRLAQAETVCRGLIAWDHRCAWTYSLIAAVLRRQGRTEEALGQVGRGLAFEPDHAKLRSMRTELTALLSARRPEAVTAGIAAATVQQRPAQRASGRTDSDP